MNAYTSALAEAAFNASASDLLAYFERRTDHGDAADLLAETFLQAWKKVDQLPSDPERQRMWLFTIARHVLSNGRRAYRRRSALTARLRGMLVAATPDEGERHAVRDAVRRLPPQQREIVMLVHWDGFSLTQVAEILGVNASTVRGRYSAAQSALRRSLDDPPAERLADDVRLRTT